MNDCMCVLFAKLHKLNISVGMKIIILPLSLSPSLPLFLPLPPSPFAAGESSGDSNGSADASLLVTLQLNSVIYQGVLFAKPNSVALSNSSTPSR